jgi:hypothetical protein
VYLAVVDGSPSAPLPDRESFDPAEEWPRKSNSDRELDDLRARAYGPHPDIEADPAALARLIDLEAAHVAMPDAGHGLAAGEGASHTSANAESRIAVEQVLPTSVSIRERRPTAPSQSAAKLLTQPHATAWTRGWFIAGSILIVVNVIILLSLTWHFGPRPDVTLQLSEAETRSDLLDVLDNREWVPDPSTLRQFEPFHDVDVWSVENDQGYVCLAAWDRGSGRFETQCVPPRTELAMYVTVPAEAMGGFGERLPEGSFVSLHLRENTVDVYVHHPQTAD